MPGFNLSYRLSSLFSRDDIHRVITNKLCFFNVRYPAANLYCLQPYQLNNTYINAPTALWDENSRFPDDFFYRYRTATNQTVSSPEYCIPVILVELAALLYIYVQKSPGSTIKNKKCRPETVVKIVWYHVQIYQFPFILYLEISEQQDLTIFVKNSSRWRNQNPGLVCRLLPSIHTVHTENFPEWHL